MKDLAEFAVEYALLKDVIYAESRFSHTSSNVFVMKNGILDVAGFSDESGLNVRVVTEKGIGFSSTNKLSKKEIREIVKKAFKLAENSERGERIEFSKEKTIEDKVKVSQKKRIKDVGTEEKIDRLFEFEKILKDSGVKVPGRILVASDLEVEKYFMNSEGTKISSLTPIVDMYYFLTVLENSDTQQAYRSFGYTGGFEAYDEWKVEDVILEEVKTLRKIILEGKKLKEGKMDVVAGPEVIGIAVHESCGHPTEADRILGREASQAGKSFMKKELLGTKIGSEYVTIIDDPTLKNSYGFYKYDDEGIEARPRYLYKDGKINEFLHNRESAAVMRGKSNASARASNYNREAIVRMANTYLAPGDWKEEEIIEDTKLGIYMISFNEWNIDDKRFNQKYIGREAYLIEDGELCGMVRDPAIELTTPGFWNAIDAVADNLEFRGGQCGKGDPMQGMNVLMGGPTARLSKVHVR